MALDTAPSNTHADALAATAERLRSNEASRLDQFEFVPLPLRHHFKHSDDDRAAASNFGIQGNQAIVDARVARSAHLVATLLYTHEKVELPDSVGSVAGPTRQKPAKSQRLPGPPKRSQAKGSPHKAVARPSPIESAVTAALYSLAVENAITKRMTFDRAVSQLDDYFNGLRATIQRLNSKNSSSAASAAATTVPSWIWGKSANGVHLPTMLQLQRKIVQSVASSLPDCDVYLAMYEPLPMGTPAAATPWPLLRFVAASSHSHMTGRVLDRVPSPGDDTAAVSFAVLDALDPSLIADIGADEGQRVRWLDERDNTGIMTGPFACLPLANASGSHGIGVLSLDACRKASLLLPDAMSPQALYEFLLRMHLPDAATEFLKLRYGGRQLLQLTANDLNHRPAYKMLKIQTKQRILELANALRSGVPLHLPNGKKPPLFCDDDEALTLLDDVCERAGAFLDEYRRVVHWHRLLAQRTKDAKTNALSVYGSLVEAISCALVGVERVTVWKICGCADMDTIATTHLPEDRLLPFLQWNERQIRRIALYLENNEEQGHLMQGFITRIHLPLSPQEVTYQQQQCQRAVYHVTWSNKTQQSLSWPQLRQVLPIRPMNARHFQVAQLLKKLQQVKTQAEDDGNDVTHFQIDDPDALVFLVRDPQRPADVDYVVQVDFTKANSAQPNQPELLASGASGPLDENKRVARDFLLRAMAITRQNLTCVRGREVRLLRRQLSTAKTTRSFHSIGLTPSPDALRALDEIVAFVRQEISVHLPGTQCQIAELQPDGTQLRFTFASSGSTLVGRTLNRGQGVSFRCVDSREPLVVTAQSELRSRLKYLGTLSPPPDLATELPYVLLPLIHEDACIGVLSVNRFADVPKGRDDETHPEDGVVEYLASLTTPLAAAIYLKRRAYVLYTLQQLHLEPLRSPEQLFFAACDALRSVVVGAWKARVIEVDFVRGKSTSVFDLSEASRVQMATLKSKRIIPLGFRVQELLPDTVKSHWQLTDQEVVELWRLWNEHEQEEMAIDEEAESDQSQSEMSQRKRWERQVRQRYYRLDLTEKEEVAMAQSSAAAKSSIAARATNQKYLVNTLSGSLSSKTIAYTNVAALDRGNSSALYLAIAVLPQFHAACEQNFVDRVGDTLSRVMESLMQRVERSRTRVQALLELTTECTAYVDQAVASITRVPTKPCGFPLTPAEELRMEACQEVLDRVVRLVSGVLSCPCVYLALHEPSHRRLRYIAASDKSGMKTKTLHRGHGVSFYALDKQQPLVVNGAATREAVEETCGFDAKVRFFASDGEASVKWPFVVVALGTVGVLALDNLDKYERLANERQPEIGLVDFLCRVGSTVGTIVASVRQKAEQERHRRRQDALTRVVAACEDLSKRSNPLYVQHVVLQAIESALNGADAYIAILQPLCASLLFTSATTRSSMASHQLNTVDSVSFRVFLSQRPLVIPQVERKQFDSSDHHTAELVEQLRWFTPTQASGRKGPFVCIPIPFVGVLSVDTFPGAAGGIFSSQIPEHGVLDCLTRMANSLGSNIREWTALEAKRDILKLFEGNRSSFRVVFRTLLELIAKNVLTAVELCVLCYDESQLATKANSEHDTSGTPLVALQTPVSHYADDQGANIARVEPEIRRQMLLRTSGHSDGKQVEDRCFALPSAPEVIVLRCLGVCDVDCKDYVATTGEWHDVCRRCETVVVVRRVKGATWAYDVEFLQSLVPLIDDLVDVVNVRVCGIVARRNALRRLESQCEELERHGSSSAAVDQLSQFLSGALNLITQGASQLPGDAYIAERAIGGEVLRFTAASSSSLIAGTTIDLLAPENQNMATVRCLHDQEPTVIHLLDMKKATIVKPLTSKKPQRVFMAIPMSETRLLCIDSLSMEAFDVLHTRLEKDIEQFVHDAAMVLERTIATVQYRHSYDQLCSLKTKRHPNMRVFFACIHEILRRELSVLHSQQIIELADDFTGQFHVQTWHFAASRRAAAVSLAPHFCFVNGCERERIAMDVHYEHCVELPMTNLPRTLDQSRATMEPAVGREKQGAYACDCLTTMLDVGMVSAPKFALCVFSHDKKTSTSSGDKTTPQQQRRGLATVFTAHQRQFFFAFAAVATDVYAHVFRACVLETHSIEALFLARDRLNAKDAVVVMVEPTPATKEDAAVVTVRVVASCSTASKWVRGAQVTGKLADIVAQFHSQIATTHASTTRSDFAIFVTKKKPIDLAPTSPLLPFAADANTAAAAAPSSTTSFFKRPRLFGGGKKQAPPTAASLAAQSPAAQVVEPPLFTVEFHVLLRGYHSNEVLSLHVERVATTDATDSIASELCEMATQSDALTAAFAKRPNGDEEWNCAGFADNHGIGQGHGFGGGGFFVLASWTMWKERLRGEIMHLETDMRSFLTGVQATSREQLGTLVTSSIRPGLLPSGGPHSNDAAQPESIFESDHAAAMVLVRAALLLCGYKTEVAVDSPAEKDNEILKEYLRGNVGRKILELTPRMATKWAVIVRMSNYLKAKYAVVASADFAAVSGPSSPAASSSASSAQAARSLFLFMLALCSAVKYFKFQQDNAKQRKLHVDAHAIVIQCFYRVVRAKAALRQRRIEYKAALSIQCAFRQHLARRQRLFLKWNHAAIVVQRSYRHKLAMRRGRRPRKLTLELKAVAAQYGTLQSTAHPANDGDNTAWRTEMGSFASFKTYLDSRVGHDQLKKEEHAIAEKLKQVAIDREKHLAPHDRLLADVHDIFELLNVDGRGELSRESTRELMTRMHIPLSRDEADDVIDMMDDDHSGEISFAEFTNWFTHEYAVLHKRSRQCGVLSKSDRQWVVEESAKSALRKRWLAHQHGPPSQEEDQREGEQEEDEKEQVVEAAGGDQTCSLNLMANE